MPSIFWLGKPTGEMVSSLCLVVSSAHAPTIPYQTSVDTFLNGIGPTPERTMVRIQEISVNVWPDSVSLKSCLVWRVFLGGLERFSLGVWRCFS